MAKGRRYSPARKPASTRPVDVRRPDRSVGDYVVIVDDDSAYAGGSIPQVIAQQASLRRAVRMAIDLHHLGRRRARVETWGRKDALIFEVEPCVDTKPKPGRRR